MEKDKLILGITIGVLIALLVLIFVFKVVPEEKLKEIEVCENVKIATVHANSNLCYFGCIEFKGEFVSYDTLKYLQEVCEQQ